jgi:hypothetical protein
MQVSRKDHGSKNVKMKPEVEKALEIQIGN